MGPPLSFSFLLAAAFAFTATAAQVAMYEEDLLASAPIRVEQWKQMQAYADALPKTTAPLQKPPASDRDTLSRNFRESIGYPAPGFLATPTDHFDKVAEDSVATYHRCFIRVTPVMETYGLYIVPKNVNLRRW